MKRPLNKIIVANRGEIAVRILRALKERGIVGVAIYSDADRAALHVSTADEAYRIGPAPSTESYLRGQAIVDLALQIGADGIHPGYGFLAENADFAQSVEEAGLVFIGPPHAAIRSMGSKIESRRLMREAGVPQVPGGVDALASIEEAAAEADNIGYPVMIKASAGGGGKGMRLVETAADLATAYRTAKSEAAAAFGDDAVYLEKYLVEPRHVEIQILADAHGGVVSLGERECSLQRRHQKVVEEAPSPVVDPALRAAMGEAAVRAAQAVGYVNAGTVEFLLDREGSFYFLEMNTRLQVEHPITEMVTGVDIVAQQLAIAEGEELPQNLVPAEPNGHAIEVRLYAEDPFNNFAPSPGRISRLVWPDGPGVRVDAGIAAGGEVSVHYDPMLAKLIVWGEDREVAISRLSRALSEMRIDGIRTTASLFEALVRDPSFRDAEFSISTLDRRLAEDGLRPPAISEEDKLLALAVAAIAKDEDARRSTPAVNRGDEGARPRWRQSGRSEGLL